MAWLVIKRLERAGSLDISVGGIHHVRPSSWTPPSSTEVYRDFAAKYKYPGDFFYVKIPISYERARLLLEADGGTKRAWFIDTTRLTIQERNRITSGAQFDLTEARADTVLRHRRTNGEFGGR